MRFFCKGPFRHNSDYVMRRCGYGRSAAKSSGEMSYARVLGAGGFPRFHAYIAEKDDGIEVNLHLDQKRPSYGHNTAHSGDYDGDVVESESARITGLMQGMKQS